MANFASYETYYYFEETPDFQSFFYGEIQVHDATTGDLLRTIQNPLPYGSGGFGSYGEFNFGLVAPNAFGYSIDVYDNLILVGSPGCNSNFAIGHNDLDFETGGRAFLFDANTGDLLHTLSANGSLAIIEGNDIAVGVSPGTTHIANATTGAITQTFAAHLYDFDGNLIVAGPASGDPNSYPQSRWKTSSAVRAMTSCVGTCWPTQSREVMAMIASLESKVTTC